MYNIHDSTVYLYFFIILANKVACLLTEPFSHGTGTLQKKMATYRHWSVSLWRDPDDVSHCLILSPDKTEWLLISATLCGWRRCFMADQLWLMKCIREEEEDYSRSVPTSRHAVHRRILSICSFCCLFPFKLFLCWRSVPIRLPFQNTLALTILLFFQIHKFYYQQACPQGSMPVFRFSVVQT